MNAKTLIASAAVAAAMVTTGGCASSEDDAYARDDYRVTSVKVTPEGPIDPVDLVNIEHLDTLPEPVRRAFLKRYPNAGVTSVQQLDAATGVLLYDINFLLNGRPEDAIYRPDGTPLTPTPLVDREGGP